jgi:hypothetical protein
MHRLLQSFGRHEFVGTGHHCRGDVERIEGIQSVPASFPFGAVYQFVEGISPGHDAPELPPIERDFSGASLIESLRQDFESEERTGDELTLGILEHVDGGARGTRKTAHNRDEHPGIEIRANQSSLAAVSPPRRTATSRSSSSPSRNRPSAEKNSRRAANTRRPRSVRCDRFRPRSIAASTSARSGGVLM